MKFFLGSSRNRLIAEVKVKNLPHPELSAALAKLPWPRFAEPAYARTFVLFVHPEDTGSVEAGQQPQASRVQTPTVGCRIVMARMSTERSVHFVTAEP